MVKIDICPDCGCKMQKRGSVKRLLRIEYGKKVFVKIPRYSCKKCGKWHRFMPNYIVPYKHYRKDILNKCLKDTNELEYEDYPADITKYRWKKFAEGNFDKTKRKE